MDMDVQALVPDLPIVVRSLQDVHERVTMEFKEKARMRLEHWLSHNEHHLEEYRGFAAELEAAGKSESAVHIREMAEHAARSTECMKKALGALDRS